MNSLFPEVRKQMIPTWDRSFAQTAANSVSVRLHGVPVKFRLSETDQWQQLQKTLPQSWFVETESEILIEWCKPPENFVKEKSWDQIVNPNCHFFQNFVSQRDFLAKKISPTHFQLMADTTIEDGLFNFLRFLLPLLLLRQNKVLFHSSCVLDANQQAHVFFGPSGAGKTTIASLCQQEGALVMGDDMNILSFSGERLWVEPAATGQRIYDPQLFDQRFEVKNMFWLQKGLVNRGRLIQSGPLGYFLSSFANLFWDQLTELEYQKVFSLLAKINSLTELIELEFNKTDEVWNYVQAFHKDLL